MGVRMSWLIREINSLLARFAISVSALAASNRIFCCFRSEEDIKKTWTKTVHTYKNGVTLTYKELKKPTKTGKTYEVGNNLAKVSDKSILHVRPSSRVSCYTNDLRYATKLPAKSNWINKPEDSDLSDFYMTKQAWWFNPDYMYEQVKDILNY